MPAHSFAPRGGVCGYARVHENYPFMGLAEPSWRGHPAREPLKAWPPWQFAQPRRIGGTRCNHAANTSSKWMTTRYTLSKWMTTRYTLSKWMTTRYTFGHQP